MIRKACTMTMKMKMSNKISKKKQEVTRSKITRGNWQFWFFKIKPRLHIFVFMLLLLYYGFQLLVLLTLHLEASFSEQHENHHYCNQYEEWSTGVLANCIIGTQWIASSAIASISAYTGTMARAHGSCISTGDTKADWLCWFWFIACTVLHVITICCCSAIVKVHTRSSNLVTANW